MAKQGHFLSFDVDYAIFETDGKLSVMKKELTGTKPPFEVIPLTTALVSDGKIIEQNLEKLNISKEWLVESLKASGVKSLSDVFYAGMQKDGTVYVDFREDKV
ncbi:hypothetical protein C4B60_17165 [Jeotgalibacillus proteolyticus]|uniref:YetF C-terminal domain-containing protein n=1 Tax=Jeotgalibacillus proteolyticus TaxID=2082395 RepID=A0A2S5G7T6_9BACL|nr:YetF domain-containing protein [Jeotgalibacillus proteolyticus]PPA69046.1 hypothetical protein C4B60_17165 [Jeotgalibacillus proteolyticus]